MANWKQQDALKGTTLAPAFGHSSLWVMAGMLMLSGVDGDCGKMNFNKAVGAVTAAVT